jgi:hypothetical protein
MASTNKRISFRISPQDVLQQEANLQPNTISESRSARRSAQVGVGPCR